jgi:hypothetical protein
MAVASVLAVAAVLAAAAAVAPRLFAILQQKQHELSETARLEKKSFEAFANWKANPTNETKITLEQFIYALNPPLNR